MKSSDRVYDVLRQEIIDGALSPGATLAEIEQSTRLGVSRTPLREALSRLVADGLVRPSTGRGLAVTEVSLAHVRELFEAREALEVQAAKLAAMRRDPAVFLALRRDLGQAEALLDGADRSRHEYFEQIRRLDEAIEHAAASPYLSSALRAVRVHSARIRRLSRDNPDRLRAATQEHLMIIDAIIEGSPEMAAHATALHLHRSLVNLTATDQFSDVAHRATVEVGELNIVAG
jgi:DNA-binding GntR family transcriptional regulator